MIHRDPLELVVAAACAYESAALLSNGRIPSITKLQKRHRPLGWVVVGWLSYHFLYYEEKHLAEEMVAADLDGSAMRRFVQRADALGLLRRPL